MGNLSASGSDKPSGGSRVRHVTVSAAQAGQRLDNFLMRELRGLPRTRVYRLVRKGEVRVNLGRVNARYRLRDGDTVRIPPVRLGPRASQPPPAELEIGAVLLEDAHLLILDKPAGVAVHGGSGLRGGVIEALRARRPQLPFLELVHRLDRDTSGCLMLAKSREALTALHALLRREADGAPLSKRYAALVRGRPEEGALTVATGLRRGALHGGERRVVVSEAGDPAESVFRCETAGERCSLVEIDLITGRTHQARVHAAHIGHPIAGDRKYGDRAFNKRMRAAGVDRLALHAHELAFTHPLTGAPCRVTAPLPTMFAAGVG